MTNHTRFMRVMGIGSHQSPVLTFVDDEPHRVLRTRKHGFRCTCPLERDCQHIAAVESLLGPCVTGTSR